jgi:hypothetical protein
LIVWRSSRRRSLRALMNSRSGTASQASSWHTAR